MFDAKQIQKDLSASNDDANYKNLVNWLRAQKKNVDNYQSNIDVVMKAVAEAKTPTELRTVYNKWGIIYS